MSFGDVKLGHGARARSVRRRPTTAIVKIINPRPPRNDMAQQKKAPAPKLRGYACRFLA